MGSHVVWAGHYSEKGVIMEPIHLMENECQKILREYFVLICASPSLIELAGVGGPLICIPNIGLRDPRVKDTLPSPPLFYSCLLLYAPSVMIGLNNNIGALILSS